MKLIRLEAENFKRLRAVEIRPGAQGLTVIGGRNAQGKSSVLDAVQAAIGGKHACPAEPVRQGEQRGQVVCELDGLTVRRTFTAGGGGQLTVTDSTGKVGSPQRVLDRLYGGLTFDPLAFSRMAPGDQRIEVQRLAGVDLADLEATRARIVEERTEARRDRQALERRRDALPPADPDAPAPVNTRDLLEQLQDAYRARTERESAERELRDLRARHERQTQSIAALEQQLSDARRTAEETLQLARALRTTLDGQTMGPSPEEIQAQVDAADDTNRRAAAAADRADLDAALGELDLKTEALSTALREVEDQRQARIAAAALPVDGLSWGDDGVLLDGLPFAQASQAQQLRASVGMGIAAHPDLRLMLVRDGSLLDDDSLRQLAALAAEHDVQVLLERVGTGAEVGVVIEDGAVQG